MTPNSTDYTSLTIQLSSLLKGERNFICNASQFSAFLFQNMEDINWAGFYLVDSKNLQELLLGPFQGKVACVRIPFELGVCGKAARTREIQRIENVHEFEGHIACDAASNSEIILPLIMNGRLIGVLDIDSPIVGRFSASDQTGLQQLLSVFIEMTDSI